MDRQLANVHQKVPLSLEQPSNSRQTSKPNGRITNFYKENAYKNGYRFQSKTRNREHKSSLKNIRNSIEDNGNNLKTPKLITLALDVNPQVIPFHFPRKHVGKSFVKERFVQANCQFVVSEIKDYSEHLKDPDFLIPWESIEEVIFSCKNDDFCCPICLHYPTAAKITRCGHIYCWSCLLHYLSLSDKKSRPCPICFHNITKLELKSVTILKKKNFVTNDYVTFNLMKIRKGSTLAVPITYNEDSKYCFKVKNFDPSLDMFHKIFVASRQQKIDLIQREYDELNRELLEYQTQNMPEVCFIENALEELTIKKKIIEETVIDESFLILLNTKPSSNNFDLNDYTYFYQCEDGQHIYLHSINIRMLKYQYQELKNCPIKITGKVIELHRQTVTEEIRKRFAHLRHLPLSCEFIIAELEFDNTFVSKETLEEFKIEIKNRKKERKRREAAQNVRDRNIEIENNKKFFNLHPMPSDFNIKDEDFPIYKNEEEVLGLNSETLTPTASSPSFQSSFANMLVAGKTHFDGTIRKKISLPQVEIDEMEQAPSMDITLSDFFDKCVKINKKEKRTRKK